MLIIAILAQAVDVKNFERDRKAFEPYKECIMKRAAAYSTSNESVETILSAASSDCRAVKANVLLDFVTNEVADIPERIKSPNALSRAIPDNFGELERMLNEDFASMVLHNRVK